MKKICSSRPALALGGLVAAAALLVGLPQAQAQAPAPTTPLSGAGSFPESFIVPGTNTSLHVGGQAQLDVWYDTSSFGNSTTPGAIDHLGANSLSLQGGGIGAPGTGHTNHGALRYSVQASKVFLETRTPSDYGEIKTYIEMNFAGSTTSATAPPGFSGGTAQNPLTQNSAARVTQAYGTLGPWLFGMAPSNFADLAAWPDTLDAPVEAGGFMGVANFNEPQIRYTQLFRDGISASGSLETYASGGIFADAHTGTLVGTWNDFNSPGYSEHLPAITGTVRADQPWGHAAAHIAVAETRFKNLGYGASPTPVISTTALATGSNIKRWGYQASLTGHLNTFGKDRFTWQVQYGQGAGAYSWAVEDFATQWIEDLVCSVNGTTIACSQPRNMGINVGYSHHWNATWRTGIGLGYDQTSRPNAAADWGQAGISAATSNALAQLSRKTMSATANLLWTPVAGVQFGLEFEHYYHTVWSGAHGQDNRIKGQALFRF